MAITVAVTKTNVICKNASDGSITVTAGKGVSPYRYSLNGSAYQSNNVFSGLTAGTYTVKVRDVKGCTASTSSININNSAKACSSAALAENNNKFSMTVFPNPPSTAFSLVVTGYSKATVDIKLMNIYGKEIYGTSSTVNQAHNFGAQLAAGVYLIEVIQGGNFKTLKIIKQ